MFDIAIPTSITVSTIPQEVVILIDDGPAHGGPDQKAEDDDEYWTIARRFRLGVRTQSVLPLALAFGLVLGLAL